MGGIVEEIYTAGFEMRDRIRWEGKEILQEFAGGLGDLGVFVPLALALVIENGFNLKGIFLSAGLFYLVSGAFFKIPIPVQPLKAMAAIALAMGLTYQTVQVAGLEFALLIFLLLIPGIDGIVEKLTPLPVIRGIQLSLGILLVKAGLNMALPDMQLALIALSLLALTYFLITPVPPIVVLLVTGVIIGWVRMKGGGTPVLGPPTTTTAIPEISLQGLLFPLTVLVIPQFGLTVGNSIMATVQTARDLFQGKRRRVTFKNITLSIALGNLISPFMMGIPMCHGSGGLTAHHRFGARSSISTIITGTLFLIIALFPGEGITRILFSFPLPFLGVTLVIVGMFHGLLAKETLLRGKYAPAVIATAVTSVLLKNLTVGMAIGFLTFRFQVLLSSLTTRERAS